MVNGNRYLPRGSNGNAVYITSNGNVFVARWVLPLVTIPLLDFVMIHLGKTLLKFSLSDTP